MGKDRVALTLLQFVDDTLIFLPQDQGVLFNYKRLLHCFWLMTCFQVNFEKSTIIRWQK